MKKIFLYTFLFLSWCNVSFADIKEKFLYCDVQKHDPEWFKPKNFVLKIDYKKQTNLGKAYFYKMDGVKIPYWEENPSGFQLVNIDIYHIYPLDSNAETSGRVYDIFVSFEEMKVFINLYNPGKNTNAKRFESICKFVKY